MAQASLFYFFEVFKLKKFVESHLNVFSRTTPEIDNTELNTLFGVFIVKLYSIYYPRAGFKSP